MKGPQTASGLPRGDLTSQTEILSVPHLPPTPRPPKRTPAMKNDQVQQRGSLFPGGGRHHWLVIRWASPPRENIRFGPFPSRGTTELGR
ncbi:hypothetical protein JTE90_004142 [Oedothorax gibbosus]|uniref:Uncharacterized protein n=1 Tax=Oedothorax gibbosus TaxID=931172 RepID=A0AAV6THA7_9ARAC|nr:hypothetical protein JTE90_004142 [Oedothorax gibbosus]